MNAPGGGGRFGELRMGVPETGSLSPTARLLHWPLVGREAPALPAVDLFRNVTAQPITVGRATVHGGASRDFTLSEDACSGRVLAPGQDCRLVVAFRSRQGGPRVSTLVVPTSAGATRVPLSGSAPLGGSKIVIKGNAQFIIWPLKVSYAPLTGVALGGRDEDRPVVASVFGLDETGRQGRANPVRDRMFLELGGTGAPLRRGTWSINKPKSRDNLMISAKNVNCDSNLIGSITVHRFSVDAHQQPTYADADLDLVCEYGGEPAKIKIDLAFQTRKDTSAPSRPAVLEVSGNKVSWKKSRAKDLQTTIVRLQPGRWSSPTSGLLLSVGKGRSATLPTLPPGSRWTVSAFSVDKTGNVSRPRQVTVQG